MIIEIRRAADGDRTIFIDYTVKLADFNRSSHKSQCKYDDYGSVIEAIKRNAQETFDGRNEDIDILIAEMDGKPVGYALGRIIEESRTADNGAGRIGLFDELFLDETARGQGLGQKLLDETIKWFREKGIARIKLHAYSWNNNAIRFYRQNGFEEYAVSYEKFL